MAATEAGYQTVENEQWQNGVFTYCFVNAVKNNRKLKDVRKELLQRVPVEACKVTDMVVKPIIVTTSTDEKIWDMTLCIKESENK